jgi:hypothetical protein
MNYEKVKKRCRTLCCDDTKRLERNGGQKQKVLIAVNFIAHSFSTNGMEEEGRRKQKNKINLTTKQKNKKMWEEKGKRFKEKKNSIFCKFQKHFFFGKLKK